MRILWIPHTGWHIPQRAHLFTRALAERHEVHVTDWVADFTRLRDFLSRRYLRNFTYRRHRDGRIHVHGIPRLSPAIYMSPLRRLNHCIFSRYAQRIITSAKIDVVVGTFVVPPPSAPRLIFDLFDENAYAWKRNRGTYAYGAEIAAIESSYLKNADATIAASSVLVDKAITINQQAVVHLIPNGVSLEAFTAADSSLYRCSFDPRKLTVGVLANHDNRQELQVVLQAAEMLHGEDVSFVIAGRGSALPWARKVAEEKQLSNFIFMGYVPPARAPHLVSAFDVGICAYARTPMDDARSPMRLLMYAAAGVPTVCTRLAEVERMGFDNVVLVSGDAASFAAGIMQVRRLPRGRPPQIINYDLPRLTAQYEAVLMG